jgi:hypothetical protein
MTTWLTAKQFREKYGKKNKQKYNAQKTVIDGESFPSKFEAAGWRIFKALEASGAIRDLSRYERVRLSDAGIPYKPDWSYTDVGTNQKRFVEMKGVETDRFRLIKKLWKAYGPAPLEVWKGTHKRPYLDQTIFPEGMK